MPTEIGFVAALIGGFVSFASPCVLPLVPAYLCFLAGIDYAALTANDTQMPPKRGHLIGRALLFVAGFATVFVLLGASASSLGRLLSEHFDTLAVIAGLLMVVLGLHMAGWVQLGFLMRDTRFQGPAKAASAMSAYLVGLAFGFGWTPCVGPILASILLLSGAQETMGHGMALLAVYALGLGTPFVLAAAFAPAFLRLLVRLRPHLGRIEKAIGAILIMTGVLIASGQMPKLGGWLLNAAPWLGALG